MLDARFVLGDQQVVAQGFQGTVMGELVASVISRRAVRQHFDDDRGIEQGVNVLIFEARFAAGDHNVGVGVQAGGVDLDSHVVDESFARAAVELVAQATGQVESNAIMAATGAAHGVNTAIQVLVSGFDLAFPCQVVGGGDEQFSRS